MSEQRLFISHASEDAAVVNHIVAYLEAQGVPCWVSSRDIPPRAIYADAITEAMQACSACAVVVSKNSNQSKAVKRELELASHYDRPFIPIRVDGSEPATGVDYYLRNTQWVDYKRGGTAALDRIAAQVKGAPLPAAPRRPARSVPPMIIGGAALAIVLLCAGIWYVSSRPVGTQVAEISAGTLTPLLGSYNWEGIECGSGPTITADRNQLVVTMIGAPTYRHEVLRAARGIFDTRVLAPSESAGETYTIDVTADGLTVATGGQTDEWNRCTPPSDEPGAVEQPSSESISNTDLVGQWAGSCGGCAAPAAGPRTRTLRANGTFVTGAGNNGTWTRNGTEVRLNYSTGQYDIFEIVGVDRLVGRQYDANGMYLGVSELRLQHAATFP
ncbi:MAG: toll/interleukin-1 receptor domain-containing protein [Hyphomonadaceae bacterium]